MDSPTGQAPGGTAAPRVRLQWPRQDDRPEPEPEPEPDAPSGPEPSSARADPGRFSGHVEPPDLGAAEIVTGRPIRPAPGDELPRSAAAVVDAYERLGGRILGRVRDLREDVDTDLAEIRSELASLRNAVEDVADRVQLRQLRSSIDELRSDIAGLRGAVLDWPELERVSNDISALRSATSDLRSEMTQLRRRIALRAQGASASIDDAEAERVADAVIDRLLAEGLIAEP